MQARFTKAFGIARGHATASAQPQGAATPDFSLSADTVSTIWGTVVIGNLIPSDAPAGVTFRIPGEPAGLAVSNG